VGAVAVVVRDEGHAQGDSLVDAVEDVGRQREVRGGEIGLERLRLAAAGLTGDATVDEN
jgi:hypothetical protein